MRRRRLLPYAEWVHGSRDDQEYVGIRRLARMVGISPSTAYRMLRTGRLPPPVGRVGKGSRLRFSRQEVIDWAQAGFPDAVRWATINPVPREQLSP